jgi:hypothetical protein
VMLHSSIDLTSGALRPDWHGVPRIRNVPDFVDRYSYIMVEYGRILSDCSRDGVLRT